MDIGILGSEHFVTGFKLAGVKKTYVTGGHVAETFSQASQDEELGVLIMNADDYEELGEKAKEQALTQVKPTVVLLSADVSAEDSLRLMIIRALGVDLWRDK